jgi:phosphoserine phosphatase RsbU/P
MERLTSGAPGLAEGPLRASLADIADALGRFARATGAAVWLEDLDGAVLAGVVGAGIPARRPLELSGAAVAAVCAAGPDGDEADRMAAYLHDRIAGIVDHEATIADFARTTAWQWKEVNFLLDAGQALDVTLSEREACAVVLDRAVRLLGASRATILVVNAEGVLEAAASHGIAPAVSRAVRVVPGEGVAGWVFASGQPILAENADALPHGVRLNAEIYAARHEAVFVSVPLVTRQAGARDVVLGVLNMSGKRGGQPFTAEDLKLLETAAAQAATAVRNARLLTQLKAAEKLQQEMAMAAEVQARLLPREHPRIPGLEVSGFYRPATVVGGDYYDFVTAGDGSLHYVVADVSGHGLASAIFMSNVRSATRTLLAHDPGPGELAEALNSRMVEDTGDSGMFLTAICGRYDVRSHRTTLVNCGHPPPVLVRASGEVVMPAAGCPPIGFFPVLGAVEIELDLGPGDLLLLYTDALLEAANAARAMFGEERLVAALAPRRREPLAAIAAALLQTVQDFAGSVTLSDDLTMVMLRRDG